VGKKILRHDHSFFRHYDRGKNAKKNVLPDFALFNQIFDQKHLYMNIGLIELGKKNKKPTQKKSKK
jgi:hypothetical protein